MHDFGKNRDGSAPEVVPSLLIFVKDPLMRLKRKRLGPTFDLNIGRKELAEAWTKEAEEGGEEGSPHSEEGEEDVCPSEKEAADTRRREQRYVCEISFSFSYISLISSCVSNILCGAYFAGGRGIDYLNARYRTNSFLRGTLG